MDFDEYEYQREYQQWKGNKLEELRAHRIICMLICGYTPKQVADEIGVSQRTIKRFFQVPQFKENLTRAIQLTFKSSLSRAALFTDRATQILIDIAENKDEPAKYRLQAIQQITDMCFKAGLDRGTFEGEEVLSYAEKTLYKQQKLFNQIQDLETYEKEFPELPIAEMNQNNIRAVWQELCPGEPYPGDEESLKEAFEDDVN